MIKQIRRLRSDRGSATLELAVLAPALLLLLCLAVLGGRTYTAHNAVQQAAADAAGVPFATDFIGSMYGLYFAATLPQSYADMARTDTEAFKRFFHGMLERGVYFAPALYEAGFVSSAHSDADIEATVAAAREVFAQL